MDPSAAISLKELLGHLGRWLGNLRRAGDDRQQASRQALQQVVLAVRETTVYAPAFALGTLAAKEQIAVAQRWTSLGFELEQLGLALLAKRCHLLGRQWADPTAVAPELLNSAGARLDEIERQARALLANTHHS